MTTSDPPWTERRQASDGVAGRQLVQEGNALGIEFNDRSPTGSRTPAGMPKRRVPAADDRLRAGLRTGESAHSAQGRRLRFSGLLSAEPQALPSARSH